MREVPSLSAIAHAEYLQRCAAAKRKVDAGELPRQQAEALLRPWTAIALLCGAPILAADIADARRTIVFYKGDGSPAQYGYVIPEAEARCDLAGDICSPIVWGPALAKARDAALGKVDTPERRERARNLCILARALDVPLTAASCARPVSTERKAA